MAVQISFGGILPLRGHVLEHTRQTPAIPKVVPRRRHVGEGQPRGDPIRHKTKEEHVNYFCMEFKAQRPLGQQFPKLEITGVCHRDIQYVLHEIQLLSSLLLLHIHPKSQTHST